MWDFSLTGDPFIIKEIAFNSRRVNIHFNNTYSHVHKYAQIRNINNYKIYCIV